VGRAADVVPDGWNDPKWYPAIANVAVRWGAAGALAERDHVHIEFR